MLLTIVFSILFGSIYAVPDGKTVAEMSSHPTVVTPLGTIQGTIMKTRHAKNIFAFRGIPYAKPPVGELRFQPPEPVEKWENTLDASKDGFACPQVSNDPVSEDCLVLNVYSTSLPKGDKNPKRPVIVYFHPGGFYSMSGLSVAAGPEYLMDKDIVLVTPNYRLAALGFLSTGDKEAPGNNGLKDQVEVLRWVKQNIEAFGGDPDLVTIAGCSAGGASVTLHMISPLSRGLFHRAISMSGSAVSNWPIPFHQFDLAQKQARLVGCPDTTSAEIIKCLKTKPVEDLVNSFQGFKEFGQEPILIWTPVIEPDCEQERFLAEDPTELFHKGQHAVVPFMTGVTTDEFASLAFSLVSNATLVEEINEEFERVAPIAFIYERDTNRSQEISECLRDFYFDEKPIGNTTTVALGQLYSDGIIGFGVHRIAQMVASSNNVQVYYYKFAYRGRYSYFYLPDSNDTVPYGVSHLDDLMYLFTISNQFPQFTDADPETKIIDHVTSMWANFAQTGNPTPEAPQLWKRLTAENKKYIIIDEKLSMEEGLYEERYNVWDKLFPLPEHQHHKHDAAHANHGK